MFISCLQGLGCHKSPSRLALAYRLQGQGAVECFWNTRSVQEQERDCRQQCWAVPEAEDIQSWLSFTGQLHGHSQKTVGTLDLGGASTQITFLPQFEVSYLHEGLVSSPLGRRIMALQTWCSVCGRQLHHR